jgi:hypothetical protein
MQLLTYILEKMNWIKLNINYDNYIFILSIILESFLLNLILFLSILCNLI